MISPAERGFSCERPEDDLDGQVDAEAIILRRFGKTSEEMSFDEVKEALEQLTQGEQVDAA
jgi:hypothetical protein